MGEHGEEIIKSTPPATQPLRYNLPHSELLPGGWFPLPQHLMDQEAKPPQHSWD